MTGRSISVKGTEGPTAVTICLADVTPIYRTHAEKLEERLALFLHLLAIGELSEETARLSISNAIAKYTTVRLEYGAADGGAAVVVREAERVLRAAWRADER